MVSRTVLKETSYHAAGAIMAINAVLLSTVLKYNTSASGKTKILQLEWDWMKLAWIRHPAGKPLWRHSSSALLTWDFPLTQRDCKSREPGLPCGMCYGGRMLHRDPRHTGVADLKALYQSLL